MKLDTAYMAVTVPAGRYYLGDPCYVVPDDQWMALLTSCDYFQGSPIGTLPDGTKVLAFQTAYGDGLYRCRGPQHGNLGVDAGLIGLVPLSVTDEETARQMGMVVTFDAETRCINIDGHLAFGGYNVDTRCDEDEDEDDDDDDEDEDD